MSNSIKNLYQFRTTSKILASQGAASTFTIGNDIFTGSAVSLTNASVLLQNRTGTRKELIKGDATGGTFTIDSRGIKPDSSTGTSYQLERPKNTLCTVVVLEDQILDKTAAEQVVLEAKVYASTAARDSALGGNGVATKAYTNIYVTATGLHYNYNLATAQWEEVDTGTTTPIATDTTAGKVEKGTSAEGLAGTASGSVGPLFLSPDVIAAIIQSGAWQYIASSSAANTYTATMTPTLTAYTTGMLFFCRFTNPNTGACTLNIDSVGAKSIKMPDGTDPTSGRIGANSFQILQYDGTNFVLHTPPAMASDAEVTTGTNQTKYVNPKQVKDNLFATSMVTFSIGSGSGTEVIAHGLGKTPKAIFAIWNGSSQVGIGFATGSGTQASIYIQNSGQTYSGTVLVNGTGYVGTLASMDATNINLTRGGATNSVSGYILSIG